jgi:hypothetical protein
MPKKFNKMAYLVVASLDNKEVKAAIALVLYFNSTTIVCNNTGMALCVSVKSPSFWNKIKEAKLLYLQ